jgi:hypothetical protein
LLRILQKILKRGEKTVYFLSSLALCQRFLLFPRPLTFILVIAVQYCFEVLTYREMQRLLWIESSNMSKKMSKASNARKPQTKLLTVNAKIFKGRAGALSRARYVLAYLQTSNTQFSLMVSKLSNNAHQRIVRMIAKNGHFADDERSGCLAM